jgi:Ca-activated chloride channel family protein
MNTHKNKQMKKLILIPISLLLCITFILALEIPRKSMVYMITSPAAENFIAVEDSSFCGKTLQAEWLTLRGGTSNSYYRIDTIARTCDLYLEVQAGNYTPPASEVRVPVNLSVVIDRSGSMGGDKLENALKAARFLVEQLQQSDYLSIVTYDDGVTVPIVSTQVTDKSRIISAINHIAIGGSTNLCGGMMEGYQQCRTTWQSGRVNKVLLLSDGLANVGIVNTEEIARIAHNQDNQNAIAISTFGIGIDYNEDLMTKIAESGNGNYYFIEKATMIPNIFQKELDGLLKVVAQNARLEVDLPSGVTLNKAFGNSYILENGKAIVNLRDIYANEKKAVMLRFNLTNDSQTAIQFNARLIYDDAITKLTGIMMPLEFSMSGVSGWSTYNGGNQNCILRHVVLFEANDRLELAMREMENGNYQQAQGYLHQNSMIIDQANKNIGLDKELVKMSQLNEDYKTKSVDYEKMSINEQKTLQKSSKEKSYEVRKMK